MTSIKLGARRAASKRTPKPVAAGEVATEPEAASAEPVTEPKPVAGAEPTPAARKRPARKPKTTPPEEGNGA